MYNLKTSPFTLTVSPSKTLSLYIISLYIGLSALVFWQANIGWLYKCIMVVGLVIFAGYQVCQYGLKRLPGSIVKLQRLDQVQWQLTTKNNTHYQGILADDCFITVPLTIVRIKQKYRLCRSLVITPDSVDKENYRKLRVILNHDFSTEPDSKI